MTGRDSSWGSSTGRPAKGGADLALRNELYAAMLACLKDPSRLSGLERFGEAGRRHREALSAWFALNRPLKGVKEQLLFAEILFNNGLYFDTHEYLEGPWSSARGPTKTCLQGLIQLGAAFHKLELDPAARRGALELLQKGLEKLRASPDVLGAGTVEDIERELGPVVGSLRRGDFPLSQVPRLRWARR